MTTRSAGGKRLVEVSLGAEVVPVGQADTEPDAWGRRVVARDHAKRRANDPTLGRQEDLPARKQD